MALTFPTSPVRLPTSPRPPPLSATRGRGAAEARGGGTSLLTLPLLSPEVSRRPSRSQSPPPPRLVTAARFSTPIRVALKLPHSPRRWLGEGASVGAGKAALAATRALRRWPAPPGSAPPPGHFGPAGARAPRARGFGCPRLRWRWSRPPWRESVGRGWRCRRGSGEVDVLYDRVNHSPCPLWFPSRPTT